MLQARCALSLLQGAEPTIKFSEAPLACKLSVTLDAFCEFLGQALGQVAALESQKDSQVAWSACWLKVRRAAADLRECQGKPRTDGQWRILENTLKVQARHM